MVGAMRCSAVSGVYLSFLQSPKCCHWKLPLHWLGDSLTLCGSDVWLRRVVAAVLRVKDPLKRQAYQFWALSFFVRKFHTSYRGVHEKRLQHMHGRVGASAAL